MVKSCLVCGAEPIPHNSERSFHSVPKDDKRKKQWLEILGRSKSYTGAVVCSDHFLNEDFYNSDIRYTVRRRLLPNAVPTIISKKKKSDIQHDLTEINSNIEYVKQKNSKHSEEVSNVDPAKFLQIAVDNNDKIMSEQIVTGNCNSNSFPMIKKENFSSNEMILKPTIIPQRPITDTFKNNDIQVVLKLSETLSSSFWRNNFTSDSAWNVFLKHIAYRKKEVKILKQKCRRLQRRVISFKEMLNFYCK